MVADARGSSVGRLRPYINKPSPESATARQAGGRTRPPPKKRALHSKHCPRGRRCHVEECEPGSGGQSAKLRSILLGANCLPGGACYVNSAIVAPMCGQQYQSVLRSSAPPTTLVVRAPTVRAPTRGVRAPNPWCGGRGRIPLWAATPPNAHTRYSRPLRYVRSPSQLPHTTGGRAGSVTQLSAAGVGGVRSGRTKPQMRTPQKT